MGKAATAAPRCECLFTTMYNHTIWGGMSTGRMKGQCRGVRCRRKCMIIRSLGSIGYGTRKTVSRGCQGKSDGGKNIAFWACVAVNQAVGESAFVWLAFVWPCEQLPSFWTISGTALAAAGSASRSEERRVG